MRAKDEHFFVHNGVEVPAKRLVCWIPEPLHRAIKSQAVSYGIDMGAVVYLNVEQVFREEDVWIDWPDPEETARA